MSIEYVIVVDSSKALSLTQLNGLFSNCGEIHNLIPFPLPRNCLREFPGLSHFFIEFDIPEAAIQATKTYVPAEVKVDLLSEVPELVPVFTTLSNSQGRQSKFSKTSPRRGKQPPKSKRRIQDNIILVRCSQQRDKSDVRSIFSTCGDVRKLYNWKSGKSSNRFFIEFASKDDVENATRAGFAGFEVLKLAENMRWMSDYKKNAKLGRWAVQKETS